MKPVYQTILSGPNSNCMQATIASILELDIDQVPNFIEHRGADWFDKVKEFCLPFGVYPIYLAFSESENREFKPFGYHGIGVETERGVLHSVVGFNGKIVHDPYPGGSVITKIVGYDLFISTMEKL